MSIGQFYYKIRRKSDGKFSKGGYYSHFGRLGKAYSVFHHAVKNYNFCGNSESWYTKKQIPEFDKYELVKFGPGGEIVVWTGSLCTLTGEDVKKIEPNSLAQAGIRDELGLLIDKISEAEAAISTGKSFEFDALFSEIDVKRFKLQAALDELIKRDTELRARINKVYIGEEIDLDF